MIEAKRKLTKLAIGYLPTWSVNNLALKASIGDNMLSMPEFPFEDSSYRELLLLVLDAKTELLKGSMAECIKEAGDFVENYEAHSLIVPGDDTPDKWWYIPPMHIVMANLDTLTSEMLESRQRLIDLLESGDEFVPADLDLYQGELKFKPDALFMHRKHDMIIVRQSKLADQLIKMLNQYELESRSNCEDDHESSSQP